MKYILTEQAKLLEEKNINCRPKKGSKYAAGWDLSACIEEPVIIFPGKVEKIYLGVKIYLGIAKNYLAFREWYKEWYDIEIALAAFYLPRSSNSNIILANTVGLLDADYQGESFAKLWNLSDEQITINPGDRIVQLVPTLVVMDEFEEVDSFDNITERGEGGDGSTKGNFNHR